MYGNLQYLWNFRFLVHFAAGFSGISCYQNFYNFLEFHKYLALSWDNLERMWSFWRPLENSWDLTALRLSQGFGRQALHYFHEVYGPNPFSPVNSAPQRRFCNSAFSSHFLHPSVPPPTIFIHNLIH